MSTSERTYTRLELISHPPHYPPFAWELPVAPTNPLDHNAPLRELVKARLHAGRTVADNARRLRWKRRKSATATQMTQTTQEPSETLTPSAKQEGGES